MSKGTLYKRWSGPEDLAALVVLLGVIGGWVLPAAGVRITDHNGSVVGYIFAGIGLWLCLVAATFVVASVAQFREGRARARSLSAR